MKIVFLTAGAAGMYCGSCLHDNSLARALRRQGADCLLQPVYTPIRIDGDDSIASDRVFFGGVHIYLLNRFGWFHRVPIGLRRWLDRPTLLRWATSRSASTDASQLGDLAVSMLRGDHGHQSGEVERLVSWLTDDVRPDAIVLSNLLIGGFLPLLKSRLPQTRRIVLLQGDDIFLDYLPPAYRDEAIRLCRGLVGDVDRFVVNSRFYGDKMGGLLAIPDAQLAIHPLSIDPSPYVATAGSRTRGRDEPPRGGFHLGYFARIAPEKGFHHLIDAFLRLARRPDCDDLHLHVAGWLGRHNEAYFAQQMSRVKAAGLEHRVTYHGSPDLDGKVAILRSLCVLCVPTEYADPKGLFLLEAMACGVPVVQPDHGGFGELIGATGGGLTYPVGDTAAMDAAILRLKHDATLRRDLGDAGRRSVASTHSIDAAAGRMIDLIRSMPAIETPINDTPINKVAVHQGPGRVVPPAVAPRH